MPRFHVEAVTQTHYTAEVDAPSAPEAATQVGDQIRAGTIRPTDRSTIAHVSVKIIVHEDDI